jgi:hypothetical protein
MCTGNRTEGSNLSLSARKSSSKMQAKLDRAVLWVADSCVASSSTRRSWSHSGTRRRVSQGQGDLSERQGVERLHHRPVGPGRQGVRRSNEVSSQLLRCTPLNRARRKPSMRALRPRRRSPRGPRRAAPAAPQATSRPKFPVSSPSPPHPLAPPPSLAP